MTHSSIFAQHRIPNQNTADSKFVVQSMSAFSFSQLNVLDEQKHVHNRLDCWALRDWLDSDAFVALGERNGRSLQAAVLAVPLEMSNIEKLNTAVAPVAWLRWVGVMNRHSPTAALQRLLPELQHRLRQANVHELVCVTDPHSWLGTNLRENGFTLRDELLTMVHDLKMITPHALPDVSLRVLRPASTHPQDLQQLHAIDHVCFEPHWRYSVHMLQRLFDESAYVTVAEQQGEIVGYQCSLMTGDEAHVTRLAVRPSHQKMGVGKRLLSDCLTELKRQGALDVTLNTPLSNKPAQQFYRRFGFTAMSSRVAVLSQSSLG